MSTATFLALGDSYTIGEGVPLHQNFPYQTVQLLRQMGKQITAPEIIAKTGWTTDELQTALQGYFFKTPYTFSSLLIGVNNQYRGRNVIDYKKELEQLMHQAIKFTGGNTDHVFVLSIPDYSVTPFAKEKDIQKITAEIDLFNDACETFSKAHGVHYINITDSTRAAKNDVTLLAPDGLHPAAKEYQKWASLLSQKMASFL